MEVTDAMRDPGRRNSRVNTFSEILPKSGLLYCEESYEMILCKPRILPLKSVTLEKLENMQKQAQEAVKLQEEQLESTQ